MTLLSASTRRLRRSLLCNEDGASLVELSLSISILLAAMFGIIAFSLAVYGYFFVSDAAREATRYAIVRGSEPVNNPARADCTAPGYATCIAQTGDIQTYVKNLGFPGINSNNVSATTTWLTSAGAACGTADACKISGSQVKSTVTYAYPLSVPFWKAETLTMTSTSQMVIAY